MIGGYIAYYAKEKRSERFMKHYNLKTVVIWNNFFFYIYRIVLKYLTMALSIIMIIRI